MLQPSLSKTRTPRAGRSPGARLRIANHHPTAAAETLQSAITSEHLFVLSRDALVVGDIRSGRIVRWNPAAERMFGYSAAHAMGRPMDVLMPSAVARLHRERISHYARTGEAGVLMGRTPLPILAPSSSGDEIRVEYSMAPLEVPGSPTRFVLLTFRDARCHQRAEQHAFAAARAESARREADVRLNRFATLVGSSTAELQACAARARRTTTLLARQTACDGPRLVRLARVADRRVERLQRALEEASETAAIQTGGFELGNERVNLVPLVGRVVSTVRSSAPTHKVKLGAPQGLTAQVDSRRIERVLQDVIERAIRRNPRGCWVDVDLTRPLAGTARVEVRDYGRHLSTRERERLVNPSASDRGWWLDRFIIDQHGGSMSLEWPAEGGVRVIISLPTHRARNATVPEPVPAQPVESAL